jgi:hypothetical protein
MDLKSEFIREFTKELILNNLTPEERWTMYKEKDEEEILLDKIKKVIEKYNLKKEIGSIYQSFTPITNNENYYSESEQQEFQEENENNINENLANISNLIEDPSVTSIECPGPKRMVIIKKFNKRMPLHIYLNQDEINFILDYFSQESRIPRIGGVFKAIINNMIMTAIDSEFAGPRFIITKTSPHPSSYLK